MEKGQSQFHPCYANLLRGSVNAFHRSVMHHGPYNVIPEWHLSLPLKVICFWPRGDIWDHKDKCLYICDAAALDRLHTALSKVFIFDKGVVWPHVNLATKPAAVEWLMFRDDVRASFDHTMVPFPKEWFVISRDFQPIMDYVACLLNLVPSRATVALSQNAGSATSTSFMSGTEADISLTSIIVHPGDIITSLIQSPLLEVDENVSSLSTAILTVCVADKNGMKSSNGPLSDVSTSMNSELEHHTILSQLPLFLELLISCIHQHETEELRSEITVKEEPLIGDGISCAENTVHYLNKTDMTVSNLVKSASERAVRVSLGSGRKKQQDGTNHRLETVQFQKHFGRLLQCPKCPVTFKFGLKGTGLSLLMGHVYDHHKRLSSHCTSVIKRRYADIINDSQFCSNGALGLKGRVC